VSEFKYQNSSMHFTGVCGYRDINDADCPNLERAVHACMEEIELHHYSRKFCLISGLEVGADQLVAQCALDRGWALHAVFAASSDSLMAKMPDFEAHELDASIKSFASTMSEKQAHKLQNYFLPKCDEVTIVTPNSNSEETGYVAVVGEITERTGSLIALWGAVTGRGAGGTANKLTSFLEAFRINLNQFVSERDVYWVRTRKSGKQIYSSGPAWEKIDLKYLSREKANK
jgi:hypothetical protein